MWIYIYIYIYTQINLHSSWFMFSISFAISSKKIGLPGGPVVGDPWLPGNPCFRLTWPRSIAWRRRFEGGEIPLESVTMSTVSTCQVCPICPNFSLINFLGFRNATWLCVYDFLFVLFVCPSVCINIGTYFYVPSQTYLCETLQQVVCAREQLLADRRINGATHNVVPCWLPLIVW